jgi:hypothetical protein
MTNIITGLPMGVRTPNLVSSLVFTDSEGSHLRWFDQVIVSGDANRTFNGLD